MHFHDIGVVNSLALMTNGQEVVEYFTTLLDKLVLDTSKNKKKSQPVTLLLMDINMPILNGMETLKIIKDKF